MIDIKFKKYFKPYIFNVINAIYLIFATIYFRYFWIPAVDKIVEGYKYNMYSYDIFTYIKYFKIITIIMILGFMLMSFLIIFSNIIWKIKGFLKIISYEFLLCTIAFTIGPIFSYFYIKNKLLNYEYFYNIKFYSFYYDYIILNSIIVILISGISFNISEVNAKSKKSGSFFMALASLLFIFYYIRRIFYYSKVPLFYILFLSIASIFLAFVEYEEGKKLNEENLQKEKG